MAVFARGVDHALPNIDNDEAICNIGKGRTVDCKAGQEIPEDVLGWFKLHKPGWIAGYKDSAGKTPNTKMVEPMSTAKK